MTPLLELDDVSKRFGGLMAVRRMSFRLQKGEILGLIGPNGAGKTTIFNLINGYFPPASGKILFRGTRIDGRKPHKVCRLGLARTFQVVRPLARLSVLENVMVAAFSRTNRPEEARREAWQAISFTEMECWREAPARSLPLGMRKRLEMARALATKPELLLLDENFAGLNPAEVEKTIEIVRKIHASGVTILIIEHNMRVIMSISQRILCINYGEKIAEGTPLEIAKDPLVVEAYLGSARA
ncbi:MAG TPA: ABC transporter ATP-binding protein [Vicinamibacteria bacterium]|jgi:branched-chain amino acid transport system ATP-binding protein|nr:ABC transporter ATP-binding protein [Vicinamibacteria bacterium]